MFSLQFRYSLLIISCLSTIPLLSQETSIQPAPATQTQPSVAPAPTGTATTVKATTQVAPQNQKQLWTNQMVDCLHFLNWVGQENDRIQKETRDGKHQITPRQDYASAIGISKEKETALLAILIDAYHRREENEQKQRQIINKRIMDEGYAAYSSHPFPSAQTGRANQEIFFKSYANIQKVLGETDFTKFEAYLHREFVTEIPASLRNKQASLADGYQSANGYEKPVSFPTDVRWQFFISHAVAVQDLMQQGKLPPGNIVPGIPPNEQQPMITILLETNEQLKSNEQQQYDTAGELRRKLGIKLPQVLPQHQPELEKLTQEHKAIVDGMIARLRQELGDEYFNILDSWVTTYFGKGMMITPLPLRPNNQTLPPMREEQP
jgi:hypothetical protein